MSKKIILVAGVQGSGKDFFAKKYIEEHPQEKVLVLKFAKAIRELVSICVGVNLLDDDVYERWKAVETNRNILVYFGQRAKDLLGQELWVRGILEQVKQSDADTFLITDFRFPIEFTCLDDNIHPDWDIEVRFCDYKSDRYKICPSQVSERMAIKLLEKGYKDGDTIDYAEFKSMTV